MTVWNREKAGRLVKRKEAVMGWLLKDGRQTSEVLKAGAKARRMRRK